MELLAPAGSSEALKAAVENGADAVYLGGKAFNARASANNFEPEEMAKAVKYAHERKVKIYVALNILIADQEFKELASYLFELYQNRVDAVIVQDLGVAHYLRQVLPEMALHASTQMTQNNLSGVGYLEEMGFSRVVLARETTAKEMAEITRQTALEMEVFVHGALCIGYSGQCLMSSYIGGRSGNRGRCAQPCRLTYQLVDEQGRDLLEVKNLGDHLLSPRELNLSEDIEALCMAGVDSLKIEGRMKRPEYVATVVRVYRKALDDYLTSKKKTLEEQDRYDLTQIFNRGFTTGYLKGQQGAQMMSYQRPNNRGTRLGSITAIQNQYITIKLENPLELGDGLETWTNRGREGTTVHRMRNLAGEEISCARAGESVAVEFLGLMNPGDLVYKTHDEALIQKARRTYQEGKEQRKRPVSMRITGEGGSSLRLEVWEQAGNTIVVESSIPLQEAFSRPLEEDYLRKQLGRLGTTPFQLVNLECQLTGRLILPVSELNDMRRRAVETLLQTEAGQAQPMLTEKQYQQRQKDWHQKLKQINRKTHDAQVKRVLSVAISEPNWIEAMIKAGANRILLGGEHWRSRKPILLPELQKALGICQEKGVELVWRLPRVTNQEQSIRTAAQLEEISCWDSLPTIMVGNLAEIQMLKELSDAWSWESDHFLPVFNQAAVHWLAQEGARRVALSTELTLDQIQGLAPLFPVELLVFGDMEMMISEYCAIGATLSDGGGNPRDKCGQICHQKTYFLKDRMNVHFPLDTDRECRMHIFNAKRLNLLTELSKIADSGVEAIRLDLHRASLHQATETVRTFRGLWNERVGQKSDCREQTEDAMQALKAIYPEGFTKGHLYRGVLS